MSGRNRLRCKKEIYENLSQKYDDLVSESYFGSFIKAVHEFDKISETLFRSILSSHYSTITKANQAWRSCKGKIYEYAVFNALNESLRNSDLNERYVILFGDEHLEEYKEHYVIKNWNEIFPDADLLLLNKTKDEVEAIISCKTSIRERLTETAFWKREIERTHSESRILVIFITTDKDNELKSDTNRYMLLHVIDYTFITNPKNYARLINSFSKRYGDLEDFHILEEKIKLIDDFGTVIKKF